MQGLPEIGDVLDDTYKIEGQIGKGGFGAVYKARQLSMDREVAIKVLVAHAMKVDEMIERFRREVMAVRNLGHPNTIRIYDFRDRADGMLYYAMEYVKGPTLKDVIKDDGPMPPRRVVHILRQTLKSLAEAHSFNIVHRDLKPANIMLAEIPGETDFVKVLDFGIAKIMDGDDDDEEREQLTSAGVLVGTLNYMSPEQIAGGGISPGSDLYALALIGIEMLTGESVFAGTGRWEILHKQISDEPVEIPQQVVNSQLGPVFQMALQKRPQQRYQSAQEMLKALDDLGVVSDQPVFSVDELPVGAIRSVDVHSDPGSPAQPASSPGFTEQKTEMVEAGVTPNPGVQQPNRQPIHSPGPQQQFASGSGGSSDMPTQATELPEQLQPGRAPMHSPVPQQQQPGRPVMHSPMPQQQHAAPMHGDTGMHQLAAPGKQGANKSLVIVAVIGIAVVLGLGAVLAIMLSGSDDASTEVVADNAVTTPEEESAPVAAADPAPADPVEENGDSAEAKEVRLLTPGVKAAVFQDGKLLGETPLRFPVSEKTEFALKAEGYEEAMVELGLDSDDVVDVDMKKLEIARKDPVEEKDAPPKDDTATKTTSTKTVTKPTSTGTTASKTTSKKTEKKDDKKSDDGWVDVPVKKKKKTEVPVF